MNDLIRPPLMELSTERDAELSTAGRFDPRSFAATEALSTLFQVKILALHPDPSIDLDDLVGADATFTLHAHGEGAAPTTRSWSGILSHVEQTRATRDPKGLSTYELTLVPRLWLLTQRRNYRIFQFESEVQIALTLLREWQIPHVVRLDLGSFKARKYKVQYAETDYEFLYRVLSDVGVSFFFEHVDGASTLVLTDAPQRAEKLPRPLDFEDTPTLVGGKSFVTAVRRSQRVRPNRVVLRDRDYRKDSRFLCQGAAAIEGEKRPGEDAYDQRLELFYYPENLNFVTEVDDGVSPCSDVRGRARTDEKEAQRLAQIDLDSRRNDAKVVELRSNDVRLAAGVVLVIQGHPAEPINDAHGHLVVESRIGGSFDTAVEVSCEVVSTRRPFRPTLAQKPRIIGVESATVVGVHGEEIDCDEFGRVRVHFHWDRSDRRSEESSCWIPVSQTWGGAGMGGVQIPRIGQEVLIEFLGGDPDRPLVTGRVFTAVNKVPIKLPECKTQTILQSQSTGGGGGHNMLRMEDEAGREELFLRAQRDMSTHVLRDSSTRVDNDRSATIFGADKVTVTKTRTVTSGSTMTLSAGTKEAADLVADATQNVSITAQQAVSVVAENSDVAIVAKETIGQLGKVIRLTAEERIILQVGDTMLVMTPDSAVLESKQTFLNPGAAAAQKTAMTGIAPETSAELEQADQDFAALDKQARGEYLTNVEKFPLNDQRALLDKRTGNRNAAIEQQLEGMSKDDPAYAEKKQRLETLYPSPRSPYWDKRRTAPRAIL